MSDAADEAKADEDIPPAPPMAHPFTSDEMDEFSRRHTENEWD